MSGAGEGPTEGVQLLSLTTALASTVLLPVAFQAEEAISETFSVSIEIVSSEPAITAPSDSSMLSCSPFPLSRFAPR